MRPINWWIGICLSVPIHAVKFTPEYDPSLSHQEHMSGFKFKLTKIG